MIALIFVLTLIDVVCTGVGVSNGFITEANPIMAYLFERSIVGTCTGVAVCVALALWFISRHMAHRWIQVALIAVVVLKIAIVALHIQWIAIVI